MSRPGKTEGYALLDALVAVLIAAILASTVLGGLRTASRLSRHALERALSLVEGRNSTVQAALDSPQP